MCYPLDFYPITYTQLRRYSRACRNYSDLFTRPSRWRRNYSNRGYVVPGLRSSLHKLYGRHHELIDRYRMSVSRMTTDPLPFRSTCCRPSFFRGPCFSFVYLVFDVQCLFLSLCVFLVPGFVFVHWFPFVLNCASVVFPLLIYVLHIRTRYKALWKKSCNGYLLASLASFLSKFIVNIR